MGDVAAVSRLDLGAYEASRAAAFAGVPLRTLYHCARERFVPPSVSATGERLCSYRDLLTLRLMRWLRTDTPEVARAAMTQVRRILDELGDDLWMIDQRDRVPTIKATRSGKVIKEAGPAEMLVASESWTATRSTCSRRFGSAPDLRAPRTRLRIVPGKVVGEPHLVRSRLTTRDVAGLARRGLTLEEIRELFPGEDPDAFREAIDLEASLSVA